MHKFELMILFPIENNLNYYYILSMQYNNTLPQHTQHTSIKIIPPDQILNGLLASNVNDCDCTNTNNNKRAYLNTYRTNNRSINSIQNVQHSIQNLQATLDAMNHEVVQVQNLLSQRDVLYHQLDHLRTQRQQIQDQIQNQQISIQKTVKVKATRGLKQLNERLRRRIREVREYIDKMDNQNMKIQQSMTGTHQFFNSQQQYFQPKYKQNIHTYTQYGGPSSPPWIDRMKQSHQTYNNKYNREYFDGFRKRLQIKQQQAWQRVKRQEQQIQNRNARSLMNFNRVGMRSTFLSPKYRAY